MNEATPNKRLYLLLAGLAGALGIGLVVGAGLQALPARQTQIAVENTATAETRRFTWETATLQVIELQITRMPSPTPWPAIEIVKSGWRVSSEGRARVFVVLRNNQSQAIDFTLVRATLLNSQGEVIGSGESYTLLDVTPPGSMNGAVIEVAVEGRAIGEVVFEIFPEEYHGGYIQDKIMVSEAAVRLNAQGIPAAVVRVLNEAGEAVEKPLVAAALFDGSSHLVDIVTGSPEKGYWSPGETSEVWIALPEELAADVVRVEAWAQGYRP